MIRKFALISATVIFFAAGQVSSSAVPQDVHAVSGSVESTTFEVSSESGKVPVKRRVLTARIETPSHKVVTENVLMFYDPRSKLFWWDIGLPLQGQPLPKNSVIFLSGSKFVFFWNGWVSAGYIRILESSEHASSLDEGQARVLRLLEDRRLDIESGKFLREYKRVDFPSLERDFLFKKNVANLVGPTLREVKRAGNEWHIVEDGPNGGSALIVLNDKYEVLKTTMLPSN